VLGDLRDWLAGFDAPEQARPLAPDTDAANRRQLRRCWVDVSYRSPLAPTAALRAIAGSDAPWWERTGLGELHGPDGRFLLRLAVSARRLPLGLNAVGRIRPDEGGGSIVEAQMGRSGGDLPVVAIPGLVVLAFVVSAVQVLSGASVGVGWWVLVAVAIAGFVAARVVGSDGADALELLYDRVPPLDPQPYPLPVCTAADAAPAGEVRRALAVALDRPEPVLVATALDPQAVRDGLRARIRASGRRPVTAPWDELALKGRVTRRRIEVFIPGAGSGEELTSPRVTGTISPQAEPGVGSFLRLRCGRPFAAVAGLLAFALLGAVGAVGCLVAAVVHQDSGAIGGSLVFALFGVGFFAAVVSTGWRADTRPDPVAVVVEVVQGTVVAPAPLAPPPPLVSPYRR
jgi:hypothetical protein